MLAAAPTDELTLGIPGFAWADLFRPEKLRELDQLFLDGLAAADAALHARVAAYRADRGASLAPKDLSNLLVDAGPHLGAFVAHLFRVETERERIIAATGRTTELFRMKDQLIKRRALKLGEVAHDAAHDALTRRLLGAGWGITGAAQDDEKEVARAVCHLLDLEAGLRKSPPDAPVAPLRTRLAALGELAPLDDTALVARGLELLARWIIMRRAELRHWVSFRQPHDLDPENLVPLRRPRADLPELAVGPEEHRRHRDGFALTDRRMRPLQILSEIDYCLYCHDRDKDSCSKGLRDNKTRQIKLNAIGVPLHGCPLDEKISEAHLVRKGGDSIGALALITIDNPMCAGTGHRICNDCMKACVFQKQEPVNIPEIETSILTDVLGMPWGLEIYGLLTRWNPLNARRPYALPYHGKNVLVVGLGPAGYTLAHHLVNEGFGVIGIDGLKIEPLPEEYLTRPIFRAMDTYDELDAKPTLGFGGVSEYGITVRWDKNFLTLLYLGLARRDRLRIFGGVRFGGTLDLDDAWALGIDHVAIAAGAGSPTIIQLENNLIRGIRKASDFLMALQLTGAFKKSTLSALQVRLPAVVIGGGLTGIDTATELRAYYVVQVEKVLAQHDAISSSIGEAAVRAKLDAEEAGILDEFLAHGRAIRDERALAAREERDPDFDTLLEAWGGVTLAYRKRLQDSPAYRLNHEEVTKALEEGIRFVENASPIAAIPDEHGALSALTFKMADGRTVKLPARTLCVAAGTAPNTIYEKEHPGVFKLDRKGFFAPHRAERDADGQLTLHPDEQGFFTSYLDDAGRTVSYYGDNHPRYAGSVVKAMASAKHGYAYVAAVFADDIRRAEADTIGLPEHAATFTSVATHFERELTATVVAVNRLTPTIVEVVVHAPMQAKKFEPGQFYRLHNYERQADTIDGTQLLMEGLALTGAWVDRERGLLSMIVLEMGGSSRLCSVLRPGEPVIVMGPTGTPTEIPRGETVLLAGGGLGNAVLFSIARALRAAGCRVIYFAGYRQPSDLFKREEIEAATDQVIWASDIGPEIPPGRPQDRSFVGNIVKAMVAYAKGELGERVVDLATVSRLIAIGSDRMMAAVARARHDVLAPYLMKGHVAIGSINSPMQCMMKEVCAQCLQKHIDPVTKQETVVFSCFNQDQDLDHVDWKNLNDRLRQNTVQEKLANLWLDRLLAEKTVVPG